MKKRRVWKPRPSAEAREAILSAVRACAIDADLQADARGWLAGFDGASLQELRGRLAGKLSYATLRSYLTHMVSEGELVRLAPGRYAPARINDPRINTLRTRLASAGGRHLPRPETPR